MEIQPLLKKQSMALKNSFMRTYIVFISLIGLQISCTDNTQIPSHKLKTEIAMKTIGEDNKEAVKLFFKALEQENINLLISLFADDAVHINPYASGLFPEGAKGKEEIKTYWTPVFPNFDGMTFTIEEIYAMEDPSIVFVKYDGKLKQKGLSKYYENNYYSTFKFNREGLITEYVEIFNPIVAARGFGLLDKIK